MKMKVKPWIVLVVLVGTQFLLQVAKEFNTMGAANLRQYDTWDWVIFGVNAAATLGLTIKAFIDIGFNEPPKPEVNQ
jgi:hypothetical protein